MDWTKNKIEKLKSYEKYGERTKRYKAEIWISFSVRDVMRYKHMTVLMISYQIY